jgi:hypothetical protein
MNTFSPDALRIYMLPILRRIATRASRRGIKFTQQDIPRAAAVS